MPDPRTKFQEIKETYEPLRTKLLEADPKWVDADKDLKDKKKALDDLKHQFAEANAAASKAKAAARKLRPPRLPLKPRSAASANAGITNRGRTDTIRGGSQRSNAWTDSLPIHSLTT